jgi:IS30 family transposase
MKQRPRIYYTESQKALMWDRWQKGESLQQIAQLFDRNHSSIQRILAETGGIRPAQRLSHETIYRSLFIQARGALKKELLQHLRRTRVMRRSPALPRFPCESADGTYMTVRSPRSYV